MMNWKTNFNWKTWAPLAVAVLLGLAAAAVAYRMTNRPRLAVAAGEPMVNLVVAARDVTAGEALASADLTTMRVAAPKIDPKKGPAVPTVGFESAGMLIGRVTRAPAFAGQPIVEAQLAPLGAGSGLQAVLPAGMRAVTVEIDEYRGVAGFLVPGCHVDVVTTVQGKGDADTLATTVVQDVEVLAVGRTMSRPSRSEGPIGPGGPEGEAKPVESKSVTLAATPEQAEAVELAARTGLPRLILRGNGDRASIANQGVTLADLRGEGKRLGGIDLPKPPTELAVMRNPAPPTLFGQSHGTDAPSDLFPVQFIRRGVVTVETLGASERPATRPATRPAAERPQVAEPHVPTVITDLPTDLAFPN